MAEKKKTRGRAAKVLKPKADLKGKLKDKTPKKVVETKVEKPKSKVLKVDKLRKPKIEEEKNPKDVINFFKESVEPNPSIEEKTIPIEKETSMSDIVDPVIDAETPTPLEPTTSASSKGQSWSPFGDNIESKTYRTPPVARDNIPEISEPMFAAPTYDEIMKEENEKNAETLIEGSEAPTSASSFSNEALEDGSSKDNKGGAEHLAKTVMGVYKGLNGLLINKTKVSERDMIKKSDEHGFPIHQTAPVDANTRVSYSDVIESYNQQVDESLEYDDDFHAEAEPLMTEIFESKNIGMSPEQRLGFLFVQDIGMKLYMMKEMKDRVSDLTEYFATVHQKEQGNVTMEARPNEEDTRQRRPDPVREEHIEEEKEPQEEAQHSVLEADFTVDKHPNLTVNKADLKILDLDG